MEVPKHVRVHITNAAAAYAVATVSNEYVRDWMEKNDIYNDFVIDNLIDATEMTNNPEEFIKFLEKHSKEELGG
ncbi:hypothetical protein JARJAR_7 [Bacillus phage vB_BanH_JarJar]|nr:hypothetical protein JARJAR_7 [Bacillus phage vB_BanH_JarJar]UGO50312.1 hypothetical protein RONSWANSON_6 [Bacillus phage vB_BanH_RonSwanson]